MPRNVKHSSSAGDSLEKRPLVWRAWALGLLALGIFLWMAWGSGRGIGTTRWILIGLTSAISVVPPISGAIVAGLDSLRHPSRKAINWTTAAIFILSSAYVVITAINQDRDLFPKTHDEGSYALGMQIMAHGRLWMPAHPLPEFFDSFYILVKPVYASIYFPGTALLFAPTVWLHLPAWAMAAMISGVVVALIHRIVAELIDGAAAVLAALLAVSLSWFRVYSILLTSHVPMLMWALVMFYAWLRWRKARRAIWAIVLGAAAGWGAITRPADAVIYALPIGIALLCDLLKRDPANDSRAPRRLAVPAFIMLAALPFLAIQAIFDFGVTGHALRTPYSDYLVEDQPGSAFGIHPYDPTAEPHSALLEKREDYDRFIRPYLASHTLRQIPDKWSKTYLPMVIDTTLPCRLFLVFIPLGILGVSGRMRLALAATLPLFLVIYALNPFFLEHYAILIIPGVLMMVLLGGRVLALALPNFGISLEAGFTMLIFSSAITSFWEINRHISPVETRVNDETFSSPYLRTVERLDDAREIDKPAVVLFVYPHNGNFTEEPVYNRAVPWPDDAPIIRAHDLGAANNRKIFDYYARIQPDRTFYQFDWGRFLAGGDPVKRLGTAGELGRTKR